MFLKGYWKKTGDFYLVFFPVIVSLAAVISAG